MEVVIEDYRQNVLQNQTITSSGTSGTFTDFGAKEINLVINVTGPVTGSGPTIQFTVQEVDPGDGTTSFGSAKTSQVITTTGVYIVSLPVMIGGDVVVSWTVGGSSPSFGGVYATILNKVAGTSVLYDASGAPVFGTAGSPGTAVLTVQGVSGGQPSPVSGTVTATQGTAAALSGAWPVEVTDGTNILGTATNPLRIDPTGSTTQPVSGTVSVLGTKTNDNAAPGATNVGALTVLANAANPSWTEGNLVALSANLSGALRVTQNATGSLGNWWAVRVTDGTNAMPTMDVPARRGFMTITDGTNSMPTGDAVGRAIFQKITDGTNVAAVTGSSALKVDGSAVTQPVSGTVTANQGTANSIGNSWPVEVTDGTNILGTSSHPVRTDPTGTTTQPISGAVTANIGTTNGLALDATLTGGTAKTIVRGGAKGATVAADVTSTAEGVDHQSLDVQIYHGGSAKDPTQIRALTSADVVTAAQGTAAALSGAWPVKVTDGTNTMPTGDAVGRAIFQKITDGTNTAAVKAASTAAIATDPSLVIALSPNSPIPTGANTIGVVNQGTAASLANAWSVKVTDGTNTMPTMDVAARAGFQKVTDGSNTAAVKAASTAPVATDPAVVVVLSPNQQAVPVSSTPAGSTPGIAIGTVTTGATTNVPVRATTYNEQTSNAQRSISSANANDTSAGTGARQVRITYYTATGTGPFTETVTLNGTTAVNTVSTTICFIENLEVVSVGSGGTNAGIITLFVSTGGAGGTIGTIAAAANQTFWAHHYVSSSLVCHITGMSGNNNNSSNGAILTIWSQAIGGTDPLLQVSDFLRVGGGTAQPSRTYGSPLQVTGPAKVILYVAPEGTPTIINRGSFDFYDQAP